MPVGDSKEANNHSGDPQFRTCLGAYREPQRHRRKRDAQLDAWKLDSHQPHHAAQSHHHWKNDRQHPYRWSTKLRSPQPHCNHSEDMVETGDGMLEAAGKSDRLAAALVGKSRERVKQQQKTHERIADRVCEPNRVSRGVCFEMSHAMIPRSIAVRSIVQKAPSDPTAYPGSASIQRGQRICSSRNERSSRSISKTNATCPISTPTLKLSNARGSSFAGSPALVSALAKPKP